MASMLWYYCNSQHPFINKRLLPSVVLLLIFVGFIYRVSVWYRPRNGDVGSASGWCQWVVPVGGASGRPVGVNVRNVSVIRCYMVYLWKLSQLFCDIYSNFVATLASSCCYIGYTWQLFTYISMIRSKCSSYITKYIQPNAVTFVFYFFLDPKNFCGPVTTDHLRSTGQPTSQSTNPTDRSPVCLTSQAYRQTRPPQTTIAGCK